MVSLKIMYLLVMSPANTKFSNIILIKKKIDEKKVQKYSTINETVSRKNNFLLILQISFELA